MIRRALACSCIALALYPAIAGTTRYVDGTLTATCGSANYDPNARTCGGGSFNAYKTVQECLNVLNAANGDVCDIRSGTYTTSGGYECCGASGATVPVGTAAAPWKIIGHAGEIATLASSGGQSLPTASSSSTPDTGTLVLASSSGTKPAYGEIGNLTVNPGIGGALVFYRQAHHLNVHDIVVTDASAYSPGAETTCSPNSPAEASGLFMFYELHDSLLRNISVSNGGVIKPMNIFWGGVSGPGAGNSDGTGVTVENLYAADFRGALERDGGSTWVWQFITVRNYEPWCGDDGTGLKLYNAGPTQLRYVDFKESASGTSQISLQAYHFAFGQRNTNGCSVSPDPIGMMILTNSTYEASSARNSSQEWAPWGVNEIDAGEGNSVQYHVDDSVVINAGCGHEYSRSSGPVPASSSNCGMWSIRNNAYQNVFNGVVCEGSTTCTWSTDTETGRVCSGGSTCPTTLNLATDHIPNLGSPVIDAGRSDTYGGTKVLPPPIGGGLVSDIGARERGVTTQYNGTAAAPPYDFEIQKVIAKNPTTSTIRIGWDSSCATCDFIIYPWDAYYQASGARASGAPSWFTLQIDPATHFKSGNATNAFGMAPMYSTVQNSSNRFFDVPTNSGMVNGGTYYVRVRSANANVERTCDDTGWGIYSQGFYRFTVDSAGGGGASTIVSKGVISKGVRTP